MFATLFVLMYVSHLLADYPGQTDHQAGRKDKPGWPGWKANLSRAGTHLGITAVVLTAGVTTLPDLHLNLLPTALALLWISVTHAFIDRRWPVARWMRFARQAGWAGRGGAAHVDQTAHVTTLFIAAFALAAA